MTPHFFFQVFCFEKGYPKGLLLRSFVNFYELDIMDEQAFLRWKEDVNDTYPGKGKALFQVCVEVYFLMNLITCRWCKFVHW